MKHRNRLRHTYICVQSDDISDKYINIFSGLYVVIMA